MAVTLASDLFVPEVSLEYMQQAFVESLEPLGQWVGSDPRAPIRFLNDPTIAVEGQYLQGPTFARMGSSLVSRRDITSTSNTTPVKLTGVNNIGVKLHRKVGPVDVSRDAARLARGDMNSYWAEIGRQAGEELAYNVQTSLIASLRGIVASMSGTPHTYSPWSATVRTNLSPTVLEIARNKMGDARRRLTHAMTHSQSEHDMLLHAIGRGTPGGDAALQGVENTNKFGLNWAISDNAYLTTADAGFDKIHTLLAGANVLELYFHMPMLVYPLDRDLLTEQVIERWRGDADFTVRCPHAPWDVTNGGANPTDANLATSTNWDGAAGANTYSDHRELPLVEIVHNGSQVS
jgi:hypothetical protein